MVVFSKGLVGGCPVDRGAIVSIDSKGIGRASGLLDVDVGVVGRVGVLGCSFFFDGLSSGLLDVDVGVVGRIDILGFGFFFDGLSIVANRGVSDE